MMARLLGGPFDGDEGTISDVASPPALIWASACARPFCPLGGVHWYESAPPEGAARYQHQGRASDGVEDYVHDGINDSGGLRTDSREPVLA